MLTYVKRGRVRGERHSDSCPILGMESIVKKCSLWLSSRRKKEGNLGLPTRGWDNGRPEVHIQRAPRADDWDLGLRTGAL